MTLICINVFREMKQFPRGKVIGSRKGVRNRGREREGVSKRERQRGKERETDRQTYRHRETEKSRKCIGNM